MNNRESPSLLLQDFFQSLLMCIKFEIWCMHFRYWIQIVFNSQQIAKKLKRRFAICIQYIERWSRNIKTCKVYPWDLASKNWLCTQLRQHRIWTAKGPFGIVEKLIPIWTKETLVSHFFLHYLLTLGFVWTNFVSRFCHKKVPSRWLWLGRV